MIEKVQKIRIFVPKKIAKDVLEKLADFSCVDLKEVEKLPPKEKEEIEKLQNFLKEAENLDYLIEKEEKRESKILPADFLFFAKNILREIEELKKEREAIKKELESLEKIKNLEITSFDLQNLKFLKFVIFEGTLSSHQKFQNELKDELIFETTGPENKTICFFYGFLKEKESQIFAKAKQYNLSEIKIPDFSPKEKFENLFQREKEIEEKIESLNKKLQDIKPSFSDWQNFKNSLKFEIEVNTILQKTKSTEKFSIFEGWVPERFYEKLKKELEKNFQFVLIEKTPFKPEEAPVLLKNKFAKIFEPITKLYGLPKPTELDPTPFLAPFFVLFFGLALSDIGYGLVLIFLGILLYFKMKSDFTKILLPLSILLGISTCFFGLLFGTFFGKNVALWLDPQKQPLKVLSFCFSLGLFHISFGFLIRFFHQIKNGKNLFKALADDFSFFPILVLVAFYFLESVFGKFLISQSLTLKIFATILILKFIFHCMGERNIFVGILKTLGSFYNSLSFISDTLSYSRLYALGLATGVIASTINLIAIILRETLKIPGVSILLFVFVLIFGHFFNIIINLLGAFVHSARLQFVEFFSKFLEGGGRAFQPLKLTKK